MEENQNKLPVRSVALVGPISYNPTIAFGLFSEVERLIGEKLPTVSVFNPMTDHDDDNHRSWKKAMEDSLENLVCVDGVVLLPAWQTSIGSVFEVMYALIHNLHFFDHALSRIKDIDIIDHLQRQDQFVTNFIGMLPVQTQKK